MMHAASTTTTDAQTQAAAHRTPGWGSPAKDDTCTVPARAALCGLNTASQAPSRDDDSATSIKLFSPTITSIMEGWRVVSGQTISPPMSSFTTSARPSAQPVGAMS
ncbi:hypothetical protein E4U56_001871 [Claviceps arundinis]|uniref:Uncharacterized protein n=1 Tax=Claviceps arundinis TaxID=1623583 RepID=A0A9P7MRV1_9HYPO|nr:hypothetical protein E4U56_001871 [Claviceps arundinis]